MLELQPNRGTQVRSNALLLLVAPFLLSHTILAQERIVPDSGAAHYVGQTVTIEGAVVKVGFSGRSSTTFLNFGSAYPNQTFTAVIFRSAASRFPNPQQWEGKRVRVSGRVQLYRDKPEIIL